MDQPDGSLAQPASQWDRRGKLLVPLLGFLAVLAMGVAAFGIVMLQQEKDKRIAKERELKLAVAENEELKARANELEQAKAAVEDQLAKANKDVSQAKQDLVKAVEARDALTKSVEDREQEIKRLAKDLEQAQTQQKQAVSQLSDLQTERDSIKKQLTDLESAKSALESKLAEATGRPTVELDRVVVGGQPGGDSASASMAPSQAAGSSAAPASGTNGQVVVINREYDFIVMNMGRNHGLAIGQQFKIVRGSEVLGTVKVEKVYDELSAAAILPDSKKDSIKEGDAVVAL